MIDGDGEIGWGEGILIEVIFDELSFGGGLLLICVIGYYGED